MGDAYYVLNTKPNASAMIDGMPFAPTEGGMLSPALTKEQADRYLTIPGYQLVQGEPDDVGEDWSLYTVLDIQNILADDPSLADEVEAAELKAKGSKARKLVIEAVKLAREGKT